MDPRIVQKGKDYHFEPGWGDNINECMVVAVKEAKALGAPITLHFNTEAFKVTGDEDAQVLLTRRREDAHRAEEAYKNSRAGKAEAARERAAAKREQNKIDELVNNKLDPAIARGIGAVVAWLKDYASIADNTDIDARESTVLKKLQDAGYKTDAHVGHKDMAGQYAVMGEYIIGQGMSCMEDGMPPHPITGHFADDMKKIFGVMTFPVMHQIKLNGMTPPPNTITLVPQLKLKPKTGI